MERQFVQQERLRALGQMSSGVAHDFNNSLQPVLGFTDLLLLRPELLERPHVARNYLQLIRTAAQDAANVVNRLREFYGQPARPADFGPVDLAQVARQAIALTRPRWRDQAAAQGKPINLEARLEGPLVALGDESKLREALINLIFNAVDAMPGGGTLAIFVARQGEQAALLVRDNGSGMTEEVRQRCLEPFFTTKGEGGTGLGLPMARGVIEQHGGVLEIESAPGEGTCVTLRLPLCVDPDPELGEAPLDGNAPASLRVLLADDDEGAATALTEYLLADGHQAVTVSDGRAALERFRQEEFDVVLADQAMPGLSGEQLALAVKAIRPGVPVALLTGFSDLIENGGELPPGVDLLLGKPIGFSGMRRALAELTASAEPTAVSADGAA